MRYLIVVAVLFAVLCCAPEEGDGGARSRVQSQAAGVVDGIDTLTGLVARGDYLLVKGNCLACHSAKLVTQNRAARAGWETMIRWMQAKHGLQELGEQEPLILDYLAEYYAPEEVSADGRRAGLGEVEWYRLEDE